MDNLSTALDQWAFRREDYPSDAWVTPAWFRDCRSHIITVIFDDVEVQLTAQSEFYAGMKVCELRARGFKASYKSVHSSCCK